MVIVGPEQHEESDSGSDQKACHQLTACKKSFEIHLCYHDRCGAVRDKTDDAPVVCRKPDSRHRQDKDQTAPGGEAVIGNQTIAQGTEKKRGRSADGGKEDICCGQNETLCGLIQVYPFSVTAPGACNRKTGSEKGADISDDHSVQRKHPIILPNGCSGS